MRDHRKGRRGGQALCEWIRSLKEPPPAVVLRETSSEEELFAAERELIAHHRKNGSPLFNVGQGGVSRNYDSARRRKAARVQRQKGCRVYIPAEDLDALGFGDTWPLFFRTWPGPKRKNPSVVVQFFIEP